MKKLADRAGLDAAKYAGHSLRAGHATSAAIAGASERSIMNQTGHRSVQMVRRYIRDGSLFRENSAGSWAVKRESELEVAQPLFFPGARPTTLWIRKGGALPFKITSAPPRRASPQPGQAGGGMLPRLRRPLGNLEGNLGGMFFRALSKRGKNGGGGGVGVLDRGSGTDGLSARPPVLR